MNQVEGYEMEDARARLAIKEDLKRINCRVHQPDDPPLFTPEPQSAMHTVHWRWTDLLPHLERIGAEIAIGSGGQRRTLRLANPGLPYGTTETVWASIQYILPGEVAQAHRHSASALRFILKGSGCKTTVDGECYDMNEGDLVLTPSWTWHDHQHDGDEPMIWLDVLDISLMRSMNAVFFETYKDDIQPVNALPDRSYRAYGSGIMRPPRHGPLPITNPLLVYPRARALEALELATGLNPDPCDDVILEYKNPINGGPAMQTLALKLQMLRPGFRGIKRRHIGSKVLHVIKGQGSTIVEGKRHDWVAGDFLVIKPWAWHEHVNGSPEAALLFQVSDIPAFEALGCYREEMMPCGVQSERMQS